MKKLHTWCILIGIILLAFLIYDIGIAELWQNLMQLGWGLIPFVLAEGIADLFRTRGWRYCLSEPLRSLPFFRLYGIRLAGSSINFLTPTADLGGDVTKGALLYADHQGPQAVSGVLVDKLSCALAQVLLVFIGSIIVLWKIPLPLPAWLVVLSGTAILDTGIVGFLLVQRYGKLGAIVRWLVAHRMGGKLMQGSAHYITLVDNDLKLFYRQRPFDLPLSVAWHAAGMCFGIAQSWLFLFLLSDQASLLSAAGVTFLSIWFDLVTFAIPGNVGILEGSRAIAFTLLGFQSALGLTYGVALRLEQLLWAGVGLVAYGLLMSRSRRHTERPSSLSSIEGPDQYTAGSGVRSD